MLMPFQDKKISLFVEQKQQKNQRQRRSANPSFRPSVSSSLFGTPPSEPEGRVTRSTSVGAPPTSYVRKQNSTSLSMEYLNKARNRARNSNSSGSDVTESAPSSARGQGAQRGAGEIYAELANTAVVVNSLKKDAQKSTIQKQVTSPRTKSLVSRRSMTDSIQEETASEVETFVKSESDGQLNRSDVMNNNENTDSNSTPSSTRSSSRSRSQKATSSTWSSFRSKASTSRAKPRSKHSAESSSSSSSCSSITKRKASTSLSAGCSNNSISNPDDSIRKDNVVRKIFKRLVLSTSSSNDNAGSKKTDNSKDKNANFE